MNKLFLLKYKEKIFLSYMKSFFNDLFEISIC